MKAPPGQRRIKLERWRRHDVEPALRLDGAHKLARLELEQRVAQPRIRNVEQPRRALERVVERLDGNAKKIHRHDAAAYALAAQLDRRAALDQRLELQQDAVGHVAHRARAAARQKNARHDAHEPERRGQVHHRRRGGRQRGHEANEGEREQQRVLYQFVNIVGSIFYGTILGVFLVAFSRIKINGTHVFLGAIFAEAMVIYCFLATDISFLWYNVIGCFGVIAFSLMFQFIDLNERFNSK